MNSIDNILVLLDFSPADSAMIRYVEFFSRMIQPKKIHFAHVSKEMDLPEGLKAEIFGEGQTPVEAMQKKLINEVETHFPSNSKYDIEYHVMEGSPLAFSLQLAKDLKIDLVIVGRKSKSEGSGVILPRLARRVCCSLMIIPEEIEHLLENIFVCTDFSEWSKMAIEKSIGMAQEIEATVYGYHLYQVPSGYTSTGKPFSEVAHIMKMHALRKYNDFIKKVDSKEVTIAPILTLNKGGNTAEMIRNTARSIGAGLIVVGSKGRTFASSIFLGSFAEKLVRHNMKIPLLVVKRKNETLSVIEALKMI